MDFTAPVDHRVKIKEIEKKDKYLVLAREQKTNKQNKAKTKTTIEHEGDGDTNCGWCTWSNP